MRLSFPGLIQLNSRLLPLNCFQLFLHTRFGALNLLGEPDFFFNGDRDEQRCLAGLFLLQEAKDAFGPYSVPRPEGLPRRWASQGL